MPPAVWAPTPGAPFPEGDDAATLGKFGDAQTGQLDKANRDKGTARFVVTECEKRDAKTVSHVTRPWYAFWR